MIEQNQPKRLRRSLGSGKIDEAKLWALAAEDEENFRRLAVLANYTNIRGPIDFSTAAHQLKEQFCNRNTVTGTIYSRPDRIQVLGRMHELKVNQFLHLWAEVELKDGFDFFYYVNNASVEELAYRHRKGMIIPIVGTEVTMLESEAEYIESLSPSEFHKRRVLLTLPRLIHSRFQAPQSVDDELPF